MSSEKPILKAASWAADILPVPIKKFLYRLPFLARIIRRSLNAAAPAGLSEITIAAGPARGLKMLLDLHLEKDYWLGTYETDLQAAAAKLIPSGSVVYDIGANIGYISLLSCALSGLTGKIFSFEALPANVERLKTNVAINGLDSRITVIHAAVIDADQPVTFLTHPSGAMGKALGSAGRDEQYSGRITVPGLAIDTFVYENKHPAPDLVKMDIEGGEGAALIGMQRLLTDKKPVLLIELHGELAARQVWDCLLQHGYKVHEMNHGYPHIFHADNLDWKAYVIAIPLHSSRLLT
ncbi:MAG: FkbM family methyltransferase [Pelolinea sp.]|nr:FkbM family methyltransferase [Pelolinea sp.]